MFDDTIDFEDFEPDWQRIDKPWAWAQPCVCVGEGNPGRQEDDLVGWTRCTSCDGEEESILTACCGPIPVEEATDLGLWYEGVLGNLWCGSCKKEAAPCAFCRGAYPQGVRLVRTEFGFFDTCSSCSRNRRSVYLTDSETVGGDDDAA